LISDSEEDSLKLTRLVTTCYEALNTYGKTPEQLEAVIAVMQMDLEDYTYSVVRQAFKIYRRTKSAMPTPADIINIIDPPVPKKKFCKVAFLDIKRQQREGAFVTAAEKQYIADFMDAAVNGEPDERAELQAIADDGARQDKQYWVEN